MCVVRLGGEIMVAAVASGCVGARMICVADSSVSGDTDAPRVKRSRSASISSALWYRSAGSFASARVTIRSRSRGISGRLADGGSGTEERCFIAIYTGVSPVNGSVPVKSS